LYKLKLKGIKNSFKIFIISVTALVLLLATPFILLQFNTIQNFTVDILTKQLSTSLHTKIEIGHVNYRFFNALQIKDFLIEDQHKDTLMYAEKINATFDFWKFFQKKLIFSDLELNNACFSLKTDINGKSNADFLFQKKTEKKDTTFIDLSLKKLKISSSRFHYTNFSDTLTTSNFNTNKLRFENINSEIVIDILNKDTISAAINMLNTRESSGLTIENIQTRFYGSQKGIYFPQLSIKMPASLLSLDELSFKTKSFTDYKEFAKNVSFNIPVQNTYISLQDLKGIIPQFARIEQKVNISGLITGKLSNLHCKEIKLNAGKSFMLDGDLDVNGLPNINESFVYGQIKTIQITNTELQDIISQLNGKPFLLPKEFNNLGLLTYTGNITGFINDMVAFGNLKTNIGSISSDISLKFENNLQDLAYNGTLRTSNFSLGKYFNDSTFGVIAVNLNTKGVKKYHQPIKGTVQATLTELEFNSYLYKNADFDGTYDGNGFNGKINIKDENIEADFTGIVDFKNPEIPVFDFELNLSNANLYALHLLKVYPDANLSFHGKTNISGNSFDNLNGFMFLENINFSNGDKNIRGKQFDFTSRTDENYTHFSIKSDYINGSFFGDFKYSSIGNTFRKILANYLPSLSENGNSKTHLPNKVKVDLIIDHTDEISQLLNLPYQLDGPSTISGKIDESLNIVAFIAKISAIKTEKQIYENLSVRLENEKDKLKLTGRTQMLDKKSDILNIFLSADAAQDGVNAKLIWQNNEEITNAGEISTRTTLKKEGKNIQGHTNFYPTQVIISDSIWNFRASEIFFNSDSLITINNFLFENERQYIRINGAASKNNNDSLTVTMNELNLDYVMQLVRLRGINFGGLVTGKLKLFSLLQKPIYLADLKVKDFSLNKKVIADATITSKWDNVNSRLLIDGEFINKDNELVALAGGVFVPKNDSLDIIVNAEKFPTTFLNRYFEGVASNFKGNGAGQLHIFGPTKNILFEGDIMVTDGQATIDMLNTTYRFNDRVKLTPYKIILNNIKLSDEENNSALLNGNINHSGSFTDMVYDVRINANNILAMNTSSVNDDFFYGKAYVEGTVRIFGNEDEANINVNGVSRPKTKCYMSMSTSSSVFENDFIQFAEKRLSTYIDEYETNRKQFVNENEFNVKVDMQIEVTPEAEIEIIVDPRAGDKITGRGRGNIRIKFDTFSDVELYGTVELEQGYYLFTLQTFIRKEFKINSGSTIAWTGDPFGAQVNINGYYPLTASLSDLMEPEELQQITSRSTVPVHCLLYLTEDLMSPTIKFGIDLPSSDESIKSRVNNIINTDEMMNRQILYLLLFHKFFTPEYLSTAATTGGNEFYSFAAATASAQINNYLQAILNSNVISLGLDWQKTDALSNEVKAQILIQPNNRLVINGNIGYRNDIISENKFIGDFDLEYKLIESGKLRFTAYNHTIDRAQLREAKTTQGVGLIYREDFNNLKEMFDYYWSLTKGIFTRKQKQETN
jgi:hypothetical protein